jgi:hypothetical protein
LPKYFKNIKVVAITDHRRALFAAEMIDHQIMGNAGYPGQKLAFLVVFTGF